MDIPPTAFIALGAVLAALIAGFFSVLGLVASKENKVSEFRLAWIDGLRNEIADYTSAVQELARVERTRAYIKENLASSEVNENNELEWMKASTTAFDKTIANLTKIHLRLNPKHTKDPVRPEHLLLGKLIEARDLFNGEMYEEAAICCAEIRDASTPLLKSTWDLVKKGERSYRAIRWASYLALAAAFSGFTYIVLSFWQGQVPAA